jgi:hypothetical protein
MEQIADGSVQLVVTSPPYIVGKAYATYSDDLPPTNECVCVQVFCCDIIVPTEW